MMSSGMPPRREPISQNMASPSSWLSPSSPIRSSSPELWQGTQDRERLGPRDLLIIDEASTLGTAWARDLTREARTRGAVVLLLGDQRQF